MKNLRNLLATVTLIAVLMISASTAKAGILLSDLNDGNTQSCPEVKNDSTKSDWGVLVTGFTGVLVTGFTGVLVTGFTDGSQDACGIIMND